MKNLSGAKAFWTAMSLIVIILSLSAVLGSTIKPDKEKELGSAVKPDEGKELGSAVKPDEGKESGNGSDSDGSIVVEEGDYIITARVTPKEADYNENPVVSFEIKNKETGEPVEVSEITADLGPLGGKTTYLNSLSKSGVLYIDRSLTAGIYTVPFVITDAQGKEISIGVDINVEDREKTDAAWDEARVYFLLTDRFCNGDTGNDTDIALDKIEAYHGGDFAGLTSKLDYLKELGINTIWITPIVDNIEDIMDEELHQQGYHGYWAKDFTKIDEHLGSVEDFDTLIDEAADRDIKIMVDAVINHAGYNTNNAENFKGMLRGDDEVEGDAVLGSIYGLPDFRTEVPEVRKKLIEWQTAWAEHTTPEGNRIAYFRVDTVKHVDHETWQELKTSLAMVNPEFKMIGEFYGAGIASTGNFLGRGQMDALLDFDFKSIAQNFVKGKLESVESTLERRNTALTSNMTMGQFLSSHDENGFLYNVGNDTSKMKLAAALQITAKGIPIIYYGEEINLTGPNGTGIQENNRYDMQFENLDNEQEAMLSHYKRLLAARAKYSLIFAAGGREKIAGSDADGFIVFKRSLGGKNVYVGLNVTEEEKTAVFNVEETELVDAYGGGSITVSNGQVSVSIPPCKDGGTVIIGE